MKTIRRTISFALSLIFVMSIGSSALAAGSVNSPLDDVYSQFDPDIYILDEYGNRVETDVFIGLPDDSVMPTSVDSTAYFDSYVRFNSVTASITETKITMNITVLKVLPSGSTCTIGYEFPATYRLPSKYVSIPKTTGTYNVVVDRMAIIGRVNIGGNFTARDYSEHKQFQSYVFYPTNVTTERHIVTQAEASASFVASKIPGAIVLFSLADSPFVELIPQVLKGFTLATGFLTALSIPIPKGIPIRAGNVVITETYYTSTALVIHTIVYDDVDHENKHAIDYEGEIRFNYA